MFVYRLRRENLTMVGTPGNPTSTDWNKLFENLSDAKEYAWEDYSKHPSEEDSPFHWNGKWKRRGKSYWSPDLGSHMYDIQRVEVE